MQVKWYWLDTKWGCGGIAVDPIYGRLIHGAPIFRKLMGLKLEKLTLYGYKVKELN